MGEQPLKRPLIFIINLFLKKDNRIIQLFQYGSLDVKH